MKFSLIEILISVFIVQLIIFIIFLLSSKNRKTPNTLLALFMLSQIILGIPIFERNFGFSQQYFIKISSSIYWAIPPLIYLYIKSIAYSNFRVTRSDIKHFLLFFFAFSVLTSEVIFNIFGESLYSSFLKSIIFWRYYNLAFFSLYLVYSVISIFEIRKYEGLLKNNYSSTLKLNLSWIKFILWGFIFCWLISALVILIYLFGNYHLLNQLTFISFFIFFVYFNIIYYKGWSSSYIFSVNEEKEKYKNSDLDKKSSELLLRKLTEFMENKKPYLDSNLTLSNLAEQTEIPVRHLSQIINENLHQNFYDYINFYRIEESKKMLQDPSCTKNISEIMFYTGFNTKSAFYSAFKKYTNSTPKKFRKEE